MEAVAKALKDFPGLNISVDGDYIIKRKILIWVWRHHCFGNLIVPVIKNADQLNLVGKAVNDLGGAKAGKLRPDIKAEPILLQCRDVW
jgi:2-oxoglutarate dehydrogenase E2 component (dihydrolipoamide succinyltransferase)